MAAVLLPCDVEEWWEDKRLFVLLSNVRSLNAFNLLIKSHTREDQPPTVLSQRLKALSGLGKFVADHCSNEEQKTFMTVTLPFISQSASILDERVPESGIPYLGRQERTALVLGRKLILSLLSAAFLCCFPPSTLTFSINFNKLFAVFNEKNEAVCKTQAEKLKCLLCYFQRAAEGRGNLSGVVTIRRQVIASSELPTLPDWVSNRLPLSPLVVKDEETIEDSGAHTLQVNFSSKMVGGEVLAGGCGLEEVRFCISPELIIARLIMSNMDSNEAVIVSGVERYASYSGSGPTFHCDGEYIDDSERDVFGNLLTSIVSIDATPFSSNPDTQYKTENVLRELNKAYVGFLCQQDRGDISTELLALRAQRGSLAYIEESYSDYLGIAEPLPSYSALGNINISSSFGPPKITVASIPTVEPPAGSVPLSPIQEVAESAPNFDLAADIIRSGIQLAASAESAEKDLAANIIQLGIQQATAKSAENDLASSIIQSGIQQATSAKSAEKDLAASIIQSGIKQATTESAESDLANSIIQSGIRQATVESAEGNLTSSIIQLGIQQATTAESAKVSTDTQTGDPVNDFASRLTNSLFGGVNTSPAKPTPPPASQDVKPTAPSQPSSSSVDNLASALSSSILKSALGGQPADASCGEACQAMADSLAKSIISDVLAQPSPSTPHTLTTQTSGQPSNEVASSPSLNRPAIFIEVERRGSAESGRSSRSSSITGQMITLHEFTDDIVESAVKDGIAIAQLTAQSQDLPIDVSPPQVGSDDVVDQGGISPGVTDYADIITSQVIQDGLEQIKQEITPPTTLPTKSMKQPPSLARQGLSLAPTSSSSQRRYLTEQDSDTDLQPQSSNLLTTPSSSRMSYAWSTASTRDEDSRPVSPTELDRIALGLTSDPEEYTSLLSRVVLSDAIVMVTGEHSPRRQGFREGGLTMTSLPSSSRIDNFLSGLGEAEPVDTQEGVLSTNWQKMRRMLLRPVATGNWGCGQLKGDPQLKAMIQWAAMSACGRPQTIYHTSKDDALKQLGDVANYIRSRQWSVGELCQVLTDYSTQRDGGKKDLFSVLIKS